MTVANEDELERLLTTLIKNASPASQKAFGKQLGQKLANSQRQRIKQQKAPDGSDYTPRKRDASDPMFKGLRQRRHLRADLTGQRLLVGIFGPVAQVAKVHQKGLRDEVSPGLETKYPARELIGFSADDLNDTADMAYDILTQQL